MPRSRGLIMIAVLLNLFVVCVLSSTIAIEPGRQPNTGISWGGYHEFWNSINPIALHEQLHQVWRSTFQWGSSEKEQSIWEVPEQEKASAPKTLVGVEKRQAANTSSPITTPTSIGDVDPSRTTTTTTSTIPPSTPGSSLPHSLGSSTTPKSSTGVSSPSSTPSSKPTTMTASSTPTTTTTSTTTSSNSPTSTTPKTTNPSSSPTISSTVPTTSPTSTTPTSSVDTSTTPASPTTTSQYVTTLPNGAVATVTLVTIVGASGGPQSPTTASPFPSKSATLQEGNANSLVPGSRSVAGVIAVTLITMVLFCL